MKYLPLLGALLLSASPTYSADYSVETSKMCVPNGRAQKACGYVSFGSAIGVVSALKSRE